MQVQRGRYITTSRFEAVVARVNVGGQNFVARGAIQDPEDPQIMYLCSWTIDGTAICGHHEFNLVEAINV